MPGNLVVILYEGSPLSMDLRLHAYARVRIVVPTILVNILEVPDEVKLACLTDGSVQEIQQIVDVAPRIVGRVSKIDHGRTDQTRELRKVGGGAPHAGRLRCALVVA